MNRRTGYIAIEEGVPRFACGLRCSSTLIDLGANSNGWWSNGNLNPMEEAMTINNPSEAAKAGRRPFARVDSQGDHHGRDADDRRARFGGGRTPGRGKVLSLFPNWLVHRPNLTRRQETGFRLLRGNRRADGKRRARSRSPFSGGNLSPRWLADLQVSQPHCFFSVVAITMDPRRLSSGTSVLAS